METAKEWFGKYGYTCCLVYFNSFPIQCFQYILGGSQCGAVEECVAYHISIASVMIITFVLTGKLLEEKAKDGTASSIREMMGMTPKTAHIVDGDKVEEVPISTIEVGDLLEVRTGEKIPVDGEVVWAESFMTPNAAYIDESMIRANLIRQRRKKAIEFWQALFQIKEN